MWSSWPPRTLRRPRPSPHRPSAGAETRLQRDQPFCPAQSSEPLWVPVSLLGGHDIPQPLLGGLPTRNGLIALLLGLLACGAFGRQFVLQCLEGLLIGPPLALVTA